MPEVAGAASSAARHLGAAAGRHTSHRGSGGRMHADAVGVGMLDKQMHRTMLQCYLFVLHTIYVLNTTARPHLDGADEPAVVGG